MKPVGPLIEKRRLLLGLSRAELGRRLGISSQTVLNVERDPSYNLGTSLLQRLENALNVTFDIIMKERPMSTIIQMGNDEFILYIRKSHPNCSTTNDQLGKRIWQWLREQDATAVKAGSGDAEPCLWGDAGTHVGDTRLPQKATQFRFERGLLPALYDLLDQLGSA